MKSYQLGPIVTITAGEALTARRFVSAAGKHDADIPAVGVTLFDVANGDEATVQMGGIAVVEAGGAVTLGTHYYVKADANGKAVAHAISAAADVVKIAGIPLSTTTADGQFLLVKVL